jgi:hypothetical protein
LWLVVTGLGLVFLLWSFVQKITGRETRQTVHVTLEARGAPMARVDVRLVIPRSFPDSFCQDGRWDNRGRSHGRTYPDGSREWWRAGMIRARPIRKNFDVGHPRPPTPPSPPLLLCAEINGEWRPLWQQGMGRDEFKRIDVICDLSDDARPACTARYEELPGWQRR